MKKLIAIALLSMSILFSCKGKETETVQPTPEPAPQAIEQDQGFSMDAPPIELSEEQKPKTIIEVPDEIEKAWSSIKLEITEKAGNKVEVYNVKLNEDVTIKGADLKIKAVHFMPNFTMGDGVMTSIDANPKNPAVNLIVTQGDKEIWTGLLFKDHPDVHPFTHEKYSIIFKDFVATK